MTAVPGLFMVPVVMSAGYLNIVDNFLPKGLYLLVTLSIVLMVLMAEVFVEAFRKWYQLYMEPSPTAEELSKDYDTIAP